MKRYGEYLFDASSGSIGQCLTGIGVDDVKSFSSYPVFQRGEAYYRDGMVLDISNKENLNTVEAEVEGTELYKLEFYLEDREVWATCDCPYDDVCKHMVAVLLQIVHEDLDTFIESPPGLPSQKESETIIRKSLKSLSKKELSDLVIKFAPIEYLEEIRNRNAPEIDADAIYLKAEKEISKCFKDDELLYDPEGMEDALLKNLLKLKGLEPKLQKEIGQLLLYVIRSIDEAFVEGYLYLDHWHDDSYFESEDFCEYAIDYVKQLPFDLKMPYIIQMDNELDRMSYDTFYTIQHSYPRFFTESEKSELIEFIEQNPLVPESLVSRLFDFLAPELNDEKKESMLKMLTETDQSHVFTLCELYMRQERYGDCYDLLLKHVRVENRYADENLVLTYLKVAGKLNHDPVKSSINAIQWHPSLDVLLEVKKIFGLVDKTAEALIRERSPTDLLSFYEKEKRLEDALILVNELSSFHDSSRFSFFRKHGKLFPKDTEAYLVSRIEQNLNQTGDRYYSRIAESLDLFRRINPGRTKRIAEEIRTNFKRRRNLMQMIRGF